MSNDVGGIAADQLRSFVERIEHVEAEMAALRDDRKEIFAELKANGFDARILRKIIAQRKLDASELAEQEALIDLYKRALGMGPTLFDAADAQASEAA